MDLQPLLFFASCLVRRIHLLNSAPSICTVLISPFPVIITRCFIHVHSSGLGSAMHGDGDRDAVCYHSIFIRLGCDSPEPRLWRRGGRTTRAVHGRSGKQFGNTLARESSRPLQMQIDKSNLFISLFSASSSSTSFLPPCRTEPQFCPN